MEDAALDAVVGRDGTAIAATSARGIATNLGIDPVSASSALRHLRSIGLLDRAPVADAADRFGLVGYVIATAPGFTIVERATRNTRARPDPSRKRTASTSQLDLLGTDEPRTRRTPRR
ncbi:MAG: hypothetical protein ACRD2W_00585 [Acidimicrobiales bacterium]